MKLTAEIEKSFPDMVRFFDKNTLREFVSCSYSELHFYHFGFGTWIRSVILQKNAMLRESFIKSGITQEDDMSSLMITLFYIEQRMQTAGLPRKFLPFSRR